MVGFEKYICLSFSVLICFLQKLKIQDIQEIQDS